MAGRMQLTVHTVLFLNFLSNFVSAVYFYVGETEKKCFIEELPDETLVIGNYRVQQYDKSKEEYVPATQGHGMFVEVQDPLGRVMPSHKDGIEGRFSFSTFIPGEHRICFHSDNPSKFSLSSGRMFRVHLDIKVSERAINYTEMQAKWKLTDLQLRVFQLTEQVYQIQREQNYQRDREEIFRQTCKSTDQMVVWWSIVHTLILSWVSAQALILVAIWQKRHLKSFSEEEDKCFLLNKPGIWSPSHFAETEETEIVHGEPEDDQGQTTGHDDDSDGEDTTTPAEGTQEPLLQR